MATKDIQEQDMTLNLSTNDAKPTLKWTPSLHQRFIDAIHKLRGAENVTPKSLMRAMGIQGLTLYHLKSHLQKYRQGKESQESQTDNDDHQEENSKNQRNHYSDETQYLLNDLPLSHHARQIQMDVQRKIHEQINVQRHLQLRIEAQGKYLQSVLKKAQDLLADYSDSSLQAEHGKAELSQLVSVVHNESPSNCSSVLTSSEEKSGNSIEDSARGRKRSGSSVSESSCVEQPHSKRSIIDRKEGEFGSLENIIDLNNRYVSEMDSVPKAIEFNGAE